MNLDSAIAAAVDYCIKSEVMAEYLQKKRKEVVSMLGFEYDEDLPKKAIQDEAQEEKAIEIVKNLLLAQTPLKYIVAATGWSEDKILKFAQ